MMSSMQRVAVAVAALAVVVLLAIPSSADAPPAGQTGPIAVRVAGLRSNDGQVGCTLYNLSLIHI